MEDLSNEPLAKIMTMLQCCAPGFLARTKYKIMLQIKHPGENNSRKYSMNPLESNHQWNSFTSKNHEMKLGLPSSTFQYIAKQ